MRPMSRALLRLSRNPAAVEGVGSLVSFAVLFPGQGSQFVGMGADLFDTHSALLGERSDAILGWSLRDMCLNGPEKALTRTEHAQPALFALSYALWSSFQESLGQLPDAGAGHSLGEYTALAASGTLDYEDGLQLVSARGRLMAEAADLEESGMSALLGVDPETAERVVDANREAGGTLQIANLNAPGQIVVAGSTADLDWLAENGREHGVRRSIPLKVAGAFHSSFMEPAAAGLSRELSSVEFGAPSFPVWANVTASPHVAEDLAATLAAQVTSPVRFQETLQGISTSGVTTFVHVGPGDVTAGLARKCVADPVVLSISSIEDVDEAVATLGTM